MESECGADDKHGSRTDARATGLECEGDRDLILGKPCVKHLRSGDLTDADEEGCEKRKDNYESVAGDKGTHKEEHDANQHGDRNRLTGTGTVQQGAKNNAAEQSDHRGNRGKRCEPRLSYAVSRHGIACAGREDNQIECHYSHEQCEKGGYYPRPS